MYNKVDYILDADIKGYFDNIEHDKLLKSIKMKIKDPNIIQLIARFLKAGILEDNKYISGEKGTPQGSILSPILANIYMYYVLITWFNKIKQQAKGYVEIINYADDMIICFQNKEEAENVYGYMVERLNYAGLKFAEDKTRLIEFGRYAIERRKAKGLEKPETFNFLGFTHYCSKSKNGKFRVKRKTSKKKFKQKVQEFKIWIKSNTDRPLKELIPTIKKKLIGHYNYYGITDNYKSISKYFHIVKGLIFKWLNRGSQRKSYNSEQFKLLLSAINLPKPTIKVEIYDF